MLFVPVTPALILPPEKPALVRASDLQGTPSFEEMQRRRREATFPFPIMPPTPAGFKGITTAGPATITTHNGFSSATIRHCVAGANVSTSGTSCRITLRGPDSSGPCSILRVFAGLGAGSGSFSFASTPTQFLFSGSASVSLANSTDVASDITTCTVTAGSDFVVAFETAASQFTGEGTLPSGWTVEYKLGAADAASVTASGYTTYTQVECLKLIEV